MEIAVCDDQLHDLEALAISLERLTKRDGLDIGIVRYSNAGDFLSRVEREGAPAISFLDIYMGSDSGVALAKAVRRADRHAPIVFVTHSREHMAEGFEVGAVHYLIKPWSDGDVSQALQRAFIITGAPQRQLEITVNRQKVCLPFSHILYVESRDKYCHVFLENGEEYITRNQLPMLDAQLQGGGFLCCHRSFLVNMDFIKAVRKNDFLLHNGVLIPIRNRNRGEVMQQYEAYRFSRIRRFP